MSTEASFTGIRSILWPIHNHELKKFLPMCFIFFCISFNYSILRNLKDTLVMTAEGSGAEALPFLKIWCVLPTALFFTFLYIKASNVFSKENLFYATVTPFLVFFMLFGFFLYPLRDVLHPHDLANSLAEWLPKNAFFVGMISIFRNWTFSLFYVLAELWGSMVLSVAFWTFVNQITRIHESKRFYGLLGIGANVALVAAGQILKFGVSGQSFEDSLKLISGIVGFSGLLILGIYYWMNRVVLPDPVYCDQKVEIKKKKSKVKMGMWESMKFLTSSPYLGLIALVVLCYGFTINLVEVIWKSQIKMLYPDPAAYSSFMGTYSTLLGFVTIFMFMFISHNVIRRFGWKFASLLTPLALLVTGALFVAFIVFRDSLEGLTILMGTTPLAVAVFIGSVQNILSKASKYSLFDPTKEMSYIPLDDESKTKGKAAIDAVGARLGKSGGSFVLQSLMPLVGSVAMLAPVVGIFVLGSCLLWIWAVNQLAPRYEKLVNEEN